MAIVTKNPSALKLRFDCGKDDVTGKTIVRSKTYSNVKPTASSDDLYDVGVAIGFLQEHTLLEVLKIDNSTLSE